MAEPFLFDDFFVSDADPGVQHTLHLKGRDVPFTFKRGINLRDKEEATAAAMTRHFDEESGKLIIDGLDDSKLTAELLVRSIKSWPFTFKDGTPVPITREHVMSLIGDAGEQLVRALQGGIAAKEAEADGPFETASDVASPDMESQAASTPAVSPSDSAATASSAGDQTPSSN